jgi:hypothetical protein
VGRSGEETGNARWVFIAGEGRSGSTLLASLLADRLDAFDCGELHLLWESLVDGRRCACGATLARCPIWSAVADQAREDLGFESNDDGAAVMPRRLRQRQLLRPRIPNPHHEELRLREATERAVEVVTGAEILVDSSKLSSVLWTAAKLDRSLTVAHLVRDPRAVAYSWGHPTPDPSRDGELLPSKSSWRSSLDWVRANATTLRVARRLPPSATVRLRYEDLSAHPRESLGALLGGEVPDVEPRAFSASDQTAESHAVAGNPRRYVANQQVRPDTRWREGIKALDGVVVTVIALPLLHRFRYPVMWGRQEGGSPFRTASR